MNKLSVNNKKIDTILVLDFGSQYTQLIARRVRESDVYSEILPWDIDEDKIRDLNPIGIILSGGPNSVTNSFTPRAPKKIEIYRRRGLDLQYCKPAVNRQPGYRGGDS